MRMGLLSWLKRAGGADAPAAEAVGRQAPQATTEDAAALSRRGVEAVDAGKFYLACEAFSAAVRLQPDTAAHHVNLAYALMQTGEDETARDHLQRAAALDPLSLDAHFMLGGLSQSLGDMSAAVAHLKQVVAIDPAFEQAQVDLCRILVAQGELPAARDAITAALQLHPEKPDLRAALGNLCMAEDDAPGALVEYDRALALQPRVGRLHANKGLALIVLERFEDAIASFQNALALDASSLEAHKGLASAYKRQRRFELAAESLRRALAQQPEEAELHNALGDVLQQHGLVQEAIASYRRAVELRPDLPGGYVNLGLALSESGDFRQAIETFRAGLGVKELEAMHQNLGLALFRLGNLDEATLHLERALEMGPDNPNHRVNLAAVYAAEGRTGEAIDECRKVTEQVPDQIVAHTNLLHYMSVHASADDYLAEARRFGAHFAREPLPAITPHDHRPLRVGVVSGDLREHPVGHFMQGLLEKLDARLMEVHAYATTPREDAYTARLKPLFASWTSLRPFDDESAAGRIRADGIDILIDLAGHTAENRLVVFAYRPAPVQISWLGYWASTGMPSIDYVLADSLCVPEGEEDQFVEKIWRLPQTRMCFTPIANAPAISSLPADTNGAITFGCFQRLSKMTDEVLAAWGQIFHALPQARIVIQTPQTGRPKHARLLRERLRQVGIDDGRVDIVPPAMRTQYLQSYHRVDIVLDTFPFPGGTTTCEALWMGVPTVTLAGRSMISRQGAAMMGAAGLGDWVADSREAYVRKAIEFASRPDELRTLRAGLRTRLLGTPLFDVESFARNFEQAMLGTWRETALAAEGAGIGN